MLPQRSFNNYLKFNEDENRWEFHGPPELITNAAQVGFYLDAQSNCVYTHNAIFALPYMHMLDENNAAKLQRDAAERWRNFHNSHSTHADNYSPRCPAYHEYLPYQKAGIAFGLQNGRVIIGDDMGLGKTVQALGIINNNLNINRVLIVTTNSVKISWREHCEKWLVRPLTFQIATPHFFPVSSNIVIINYELLDKYKKALKHKQWDLIIADECQNLKNPSAKRSLVFYELESPYAIGLTGTPILNRLEEVYPFIHWLKPSEFPSKREFLWKYRDKPEEAQLALRSSVLIRRMKKDVLLDLPPKTRQIIELPAKGLESILAEEIEVFTKKKIILEHLQEAVKRAKEASDLTSYRAAVEQLRLQRGLILREIARVRLQTGLAKVPYLIKYIEELGDDLDKLTIFCHHLEVQTKILEYFGSMAVVHNGTIGPEKKHENLRRFEHDASCKYLIVGIKTAVGFNEAARVCSHGIMGELDWTPANLWQAEDRLWRKGQKNAVNIYYAVLEGSLDVHVARILVNKQDLIERSLDGSASDYSQNNNEAEQRV